MLSESQVNKTTYWKYTSLFRMVSFSHFLNHFLKVSLDSFGNCSRLNIKSSLYYRKSFLLWQFKKLHQKGIISFTHKEVPHKLEEIAQLLICID